VNSTRTVRERGCSVPVARKPGPPPDFAKMAREFQTACGDGTPVRRASKYNRPARPREASPATVEFKAAVRRRRAKLGLTQGRVSQLAGVSRGFVERLEAGTLSADAPQVAAILRVLGLKAGDT
jgi:DNA-binding XRE family transcriptional regulator